MYILALLLFVASVTANPLRPAEQNFQFISGRLVGGHDAIPHSAPWIVSLQWIDERIRHRCGGSIIDAEWILTAAHCLDALPETGYYEVVAGRHNISMATEQYEQRRRIDRFFIHEAFAGIAAGVGPFDIGLIRLEVPLELNSAVAVIALPPPDVVPSGTVQLHGWGSVSRGFTARMPDILQTVAKPTIPLNVCRLVLGAAQVHETNLCTGPLTGGVASCGGDSGGPLMQNGQVVGVVSWGVSPCGLFGMPSVYGRVSAFVPWINETRSRYSCGN